VRAIGLERVVSPAGVLPQAAERLDASAEIAPHEVRVRVERLNLDAASYRQLWGAHGGDGDAVRAAVLEIVAGQDAEPGDRVRRDAGRRGRRGRPVLAARAAGR